MNWRELLSEWFVTIIAWISGIVVVGSMVLLIYGVWAGQQPSKQVVEHWNGGPQDPIETH